MNKLSKVYDTTMRRMTSVVFVIVIMVGMLAGCKNDGPQVELAEIATPAPEPLLAAIATPPPYSMESAKGVYGDIVNDDYRITFLGMVDYNLLPEEQNEISVDDKAIAVGYSIESLSNENINLNNSIFRLVDTASMSSYSVKWTKDNNIEQWNKEKKKDERVPVECGRLIFVVPLEVNIDDLMLIITISGTEYYFMASKPQETISGAAIDYTNMCALCSLDSVSYNYETLVISECQFCHRKFTSGHEPKQAICFSCSALNSYCTQCMRYIDNNSEGLE